MWFSFFGRLGNSQICSRLYRQWHIFNNNCGVYRYAHKQTYTHSVTACNFTNFFFATSGENQLTSGGKSSRNWHCNAYMIYSVTLSSRVCLSIKFCFVDFCPLVFFFRQIFKSEGIFSFFSSFFKWVLRGVVWKTFFWSRSIKKKN